MPVHDAVVVSCEHASDRVPAAFRPYFVGADELLASHRGSDIGARAMAEHLAKHLEAPLFVGRATRLLVDLNRSIGHPKLFSERIRDLESSRKHEIIAEYYLPYRFSVLHAIAELVAAGRRVLHLSVHSFTPNLGGEERRADMSFLYDPKRAHERALCAAWMAAIERIDPTVVVRRNYPYRGDSDGFTTALRRRFDSEQYLGIELETNQRIAGHGRSRTRLLAVIKAAYDEITATSA